MKPMLWTVRICSTLGIIFGAIATLFGNPEMGIPDISVSLLALWISWLTGTDNRGNH